MNQSAVIYLCGFMGAGKTRIGRLVADAIGVPFKDLDQQIVKGEKRSVNQIFEESGEGKFRELESRYLKKSAAEGSAVIALGGGTLQHPSNLSFVKESGLLVFIDTPFPELVSRLVKKTDRPLLKHDDGSQRDRDELESFLHQLYKRRLPVYRQADIIFESGPESVQENAEKLIHQLKLLK